MKRCILVVLDSVGKGYTPDADLYGDVGANTLIHTVNATNIKLPNMSKLGLFGSSGTDFIEGSYGLAKELSKGKGTIEGHWEMTGIETKVPFETFPDGFPSEMLDLIKEKTGYTCLCNKAASGTEVIKDYGVEHMESNKPIFYTSADSVFQIACHEETFGLNNLYKLCEDVREILNESKWNISRIIARPFVGNSKETFKRTSNRKDYSITPPQKNLLNILYANDINVVGVGKISDIFCNKGISQSYHTKGNTDGINKTIELSKETPYKDEFIFVNLVDFDMLYGHRRDVNGYANALVEFDNALPKIIENLKGDDMLIITADHGCDPTFKGTDHTREIVPILVAGPNIKTENSIHIRDSFADIGQTIAEYFNCQKLDVGKSFLNEIR